MLISRIFCRSLRIAVAAVACFALAGPAGAGTVFSWQTEDGTHAFTNQKKQVPARYRDQATTRQVSRLSGYARLTPTPKAAKGSYADRMRARLAVLRNERQPEPAAQAGIAAGIPLAVTSGGSRHGGHGVIIPVNAAADSDEPIVIEQRRMRAADSLATRHVTVVRHGERTRLVMKDELSQRSYQGTDFPAPRETDFE